MDDFNSVCLPPPLSDVGPFVCVHIAWTGLFNLDAANRSHETALHLVARNGSCALATVGPVPIFDLVSASLTFASLTW